MAPPDIEDRTMETCDEFDSGVSDGINSSYNVEQHIKFCEPAQELNVDEFDIEMEYMDKLEYDSTSESAATFNENDLVLESIDDDSVIAGPSKIQYCYQTPQTPNVDFLLDTSDKPEFLACLQLQQSKDIINANRSTFATPSNLPTVNRKSKSDEENTNAQSQVDIPPTQIVSNDSFVSTAARDKCLRPTFKIDGLVSRRTTQILKPKCKKTKKNADNVEKTYKKIKKNKYSSVVKPMKRANSDECGCKLEDQCGEGCLNRSLLIECGSNCPCGDKCLNKMIQKNIMARVERFMTNDKGWGIRACQSIESGAFIIEYVGEIINAKTYTKRMETDYKNDYHHYCLKMSTDEYIDAYRMGNLSRFVNHSCKANCTMQKWVVNGLHRMALFASTDIQEGEEITFNYNFSPFRDAQTCKCGEETCSGYIATQSMVQCKPTSRLSKPLHDNTFYGFKKSDIDHAQNAIDSKKLVLAKSNLSLVGIGIHDHTTTIKTGVDEMNCNGKHSENDFDWKASKTSGKPNICMKIVGHQ